MLRKRDVALWAGLVLYLMVGQPGWALPIWDSDASGELVGSRTSVNDPFGGIDGTEEWDGGTPADPHFEVGWEITYDENTGYWTYVYGVSGNTKGISHFLVEVTQGANFTYDSEGTSAPVEGPTDGWADNEHSNPLMPNDLYGVKFDYGGLTFHEYTLVTRHAPVYGVGYWKDGKTGGNPVVAWTNALNFSDYRTNEGLTTLDFIVRPNGISPTTTDEGGANPEPTSVLLGSLGLMALLYRRRR